MSDTWSERALKKKNYKRGGIEPDPPKKGHNRSKKKQFVLQYYGRKCKFNRIQLDNKWVYRRSDEWEWGNWGKFVKLEDAIKSGKANSSRGIYREHPWRIIDIKTKEVLWEVEGTK